eukprot:13620951-Ditylum_brightwellii.AAC.1
MQKCKWIRNFLGECTNQCQEHYSEDCSIIGDGGKDYCKGAVCTRQGILQAHPGKHGVEESGVLEIKWLKGNENLVDIFTKNLSGPAYNKCAKIFVGKDSYNK